MFKWGVQGGQGATKKQPQETGAAFEICLLRYGKECSTEELKIYCLKPHVSNRKRGDCCISEESQAEGGGGTFRFRKSAKIK